MASNNGSKTSVETAPSSEMETFFDSAPPLRNSSEITEKLNDFIRRNSTLTGNGRANRVVCVTSGGTTVPLEQRCVRYIDNFSSGHRGATSTEYFIKAGYAVIFLYRSFCDVIVVVELFYTGEPTNLIADLFQMIPFLSVLNTPKSPKFKSHILVREPHSEAVKMAIKDHRTAVENGLLLKLPFTTIFEYLQMLQMIATAMKTLEARAMFYLAAAVSDFYVPWQSMAEHKIQSGSGPLDMRLAQVPKMLAALRKEWAPTAYCISFKLETDSEILLEKAGMALSKYQMHAVVANELSTRKEVVVVVTSDERVSVRRENNIDVEDPLIELLVQKHSSHIGNSHT